MILISEKKRMVRFLFLSYKVIDPHPHLERNESYLAVVPAASVKLHLLLGALATQPHPTICPLSVVCLQKKLLVQMHLYLNERKGYILSEDDYAITSIYYYFCWHQSSMYKLTNRMQLGNFHLLLCRQYRSSDIYSMVSLRPIHIFSVFH